MLLLGIAQMGPLLSLMKLGKIGNLKPDQKTFLIPCVDLVSLHVRSVQVQDHHQIHNVPNASARVPPTIRNGFMEMDRVFLLLSKKETMVRYTKMPLAKSSQKVRLSTFSSR